MSCRLRELAKPQLPLPSTAQLTTIIDALEPTVLNPVAQGLTWLRDRLDPIHAMEQSEAMEIQEAERLQAEERKRKREMKRAAAKRETEAKAEAEAIVPYQLKDPSMKKMSGGEKLKKDMERKRRPDGPRKEFGLMDTNYHHPRLDLEDGDKPFHTKIQNKEKYEPKVTTYGEKYGPGLRGELPRSKDRVSESTRQDEKSKSEKGHRPKLEYQTVVLEPETLDVPNTKGHPSDVKIRLYPEEEERVGRELKEALDTNFFKHWPVKTEAGPETGNRSKPEESKEFTAPLSDEAQARKLELMKQWKSKEEKDNKKRRSTKKRAEYEDDEMMDMLITTSLFKPTLEPYIGTGKKIPTREAVLDEYEQASVYEDAFEVQPLVSMDNDTMKSQGKWDNSKVAAQVSKNEESKTERKKYQRSMLPRRPRPSANTNDLQMPKVTDRKFSIPRRIHQAKSTNRKSDEEGPAFAPRK